MGFQQMTSLRDKDELAEKSPTLKRFFSRNFDNEIDELLAKGSSL
jgi:hypothetical protein